MNTSTATTRKTEILAGITTFLAAMYIIIVNPAILSEAGMPFSGVLTATVLVSAFSSILMGLYARNPILLAPGMGLNAFFAYSVVVGMGVSWPTALGAVFWSGILFVLLSVFGIRELLIKAIPQQLRYGVASGIGLFIAFIGLQNSGFIVDDKTTLLSFGTLDASTLTFIAGCAVTMVLVAKRVKGALILGIIATTIFAVPAGRLWATDIAHPLVEWKGVFAPPDFSLFGRLDLLASLQLSIWHVTFTLFFTDLFDSISTFVGVAEAAQLKDARGNPRNIRQSMIVDGIATAMSGLVGTSSTTSYIESASGIEEGGRGGTTAVVAGLCFLPFMFFSPLLNLVPRIATAPALIIVGAFMMKPVLKIKWDTYDSAIPAFLSLILVPLTYSITHGIIWGFLSWTVIKLVLGKFEDVTPTLLVIDVLAIVFFIV
jgi:AGZA family xanthine/uracil permease-like MFS transporter